MFFFFKQKTAYEMRISDWVQTCALPISCKCYLADGHAAALDQLQHAAAAQMRLGQLEHGAVIIFGELGCGGRADRGEHRMRMADDGRDVDADAADDLAQFMEIGRAACRERVCPYV